MFNGEIGFTGERSYNAAQKPTSGVARVERERTVDQSDHCAYFLAELSEHMGGVGEHSRVILCHLKRLPSEFDGLATARLRIFGPAVSDEPQVADRR
jgi:hypothetical protein